MCPARRGIPRGTVAPKLGFSLYGIPHSAVSRSARLGPQCGTEAHLGFVAIKLIAALPGLALCATAISVAMSHAASAGDFKQPIVQLAMSALPVMQPIMQLMQPGFVAIMFCFAASSVVLLNAIIVATSHPPPPPLPPLPPPPPGALQLSEAQQTTFMYMTPPACISEHVWRVLTTYAVFTVPDSCMCARAHTGVCVRACACGRV